MAPCFLQPFDTALHGILSLTSAVGLSLHNVRFWTPAASFARYSMRLSVSYEVSFGTHVSLEMNAYQSYRN